MDFSDLDRIATNFEQLATDGEALLYALKETRSSNNPVPGNLRAECINLASEYAAFDSEFSALVTDVMGFRNSSESDELVHRFHECSETMQTLASLISNMYMACVERGDFSVMAEWQKYFCEHYPDVLRKTKWLADSLRDFLKRYEMICVYASPGIMFTELRGDPDEVYPFNHAEEPDEPIMREVYGSPEMTNRTIVLDDLPLVDVDLIETTFFCPECGENIPMSSKRCPRCGFVLVF